jgi:iron complex outermembrane receptor protein
MSRRGLCCSGAAIFGVIWAYAGAAYADAPPQVSDLRDLTIEQLANLEVTSVSRRPESLSEAPAAIDVITADDIHRSGAQSLPEVLRLARNLEVARIDAQYYAISARGFNTFQASNKLLVLIDGRSVYTPLYSGVFWDQQQVQLQDIERIEVVSGPGGTLWGANAVNGVINIITRSSADTEGLQADLFAGDVDSRADLRFGGQAGHINYRVWGTALERGSTLTPAGDEVGDDWRLGQIGFRADWGDVEDSFMLQGAAHERFGDDLDNSGAHLLGRWTRLLRNGSTVEVQTYASRAAAAAGGVSDALETFDIEAQHSLRIRDVHSMVWGGGYRVSESEFINPTSPSGLVEEQRTLRVASLFVQDEIALSETLSLTLGVKVEDHTFTDLEYMPNARLAWRPNDHSLVWAAVSRAVRTPSRIDRELVSPGVIDPGFFESEYLIAYELGYRTQPTQWVTFSANLYYHDYEDLRTVNLTPPGMLPAHYGNGLHGAVYGAEVWGDFAINEAWRINAGFTLLEQDLELDPLAIDLNGSGDDPGYHVFVRSRHDIAEDWTLALAARAIDEIAPEIPDYVELDARLGWQLNDNVEIALAGHNLLDEAHPESMDGPLQENRRRIQLSARLTY